MLRTWQSSQVLCQLRKGPTRPKCSCEDTQQGHRPVRDSEVQSFKDLLTFISFALYVSEIPWPRVRCNAKHAKSTHPSSNIPKRGHGTLAIPVQKRTLSFTRANYCIIDKESIVLRTANHSLHHCRKNLRASESYRKMFLNQHSLWKH